MDQSPALTTLSSIAKRHLILTRDEWVPLHNQISREIVWAINTPHLHQNAPAHIRIINARRNAKGAITPLMHQIAIVEMVPGYCAMIIAARRTVDKGVIDIE